MGNSETALGLLPDQSQLFGAEIPLLLKPPPRTPLSQLSFQPLPTSLQARDGIQK